MKKNTVNLIKLSTLFAEFTDDEVLELIYNNNTRLKDYKKDAVIYFQNEICNSLNIVLEGEVIIQKIDENGNVLTINTFPAGNDIGGNILFSKKNFYPMTITAKSDCTLFQINKEIILELCQTKVGFLKSLLESISTKALILTSKLNSVTMKTIRECIVDFLKYEYYRQNNIKIKLNLSKKELAEKMGIQRTSLSRELNKMKKDGLIDFDKDSITIIDLSLIKKE